MSGIILHHFESSTFSEKARLMLGFKGLAWHSVIVPNIMPKPDLLPLTGGYRRTPIMQIGADIYCDTRMIAMELDRRFPVPSLYHGAAGMADAVQLWADRQLFDATMRYVNALKADERPEAYHRDRALMRGETFDLGAIRASLPRHREQVRAYLGWIGSMLTRDRQFILGRSPSIIDISVYHCLWYLRSAGTEARALLEGRQAIADWMARVETMGHGARTEMDPAHALAIAREATSSIPERADPDDPDGFSPGTPVAVAADDYGRDPVTGTVVAIDTACIAIRRRDERTGDVVVHFPRVGFCVTKVADGAV